MNERTQPSSAPLKPLLRGVNLAAYIRAEMGLGQSARGLAAALEAAQLPFNILNFEHGNPARHGDLSWAHKERDNSDYDVTIVAINPDNIFNARRRLPTGIFVNRYVIGYWFWELSNIPVEWQEAFSLVDEVWVASRFVQEALADKSPVPVFLVPPVVRVTEVSELSRDHFNLPEKRFLFFNACDAASVLERKNPRSTVAAFKKAFAPDDNTVGLVVKISEPRKKTFSLDGLSRTLTGGYSQPTLDLIKKDIQGYENIHLIDRLLTPEELRSLLKITNCYVSLHRSEGFGLVPAEAMSLGKPVIVTRWSGTTDYMTGDNSVGVGYELVRLGRDYGPYEADQSWAEPDIDEAARWMTRLASDPVLAMEIGKRGQRTVLNKYSAETVGAIIKERLAFVRRERASS